MIKVIRGKNGVGKSTLIKEFIKKGVISYSPQDIEISLYKSSLDYLCNDQMSKCDVEKLLDELGVLYIIDWNLKYLSNGKKRYLQSIKYLISDSKVIGLDEPTNDLDYKIVQDLIAIIKYFSKTKQIYIITHDERLFGIGEDYEYTKDLNQLRNELGLLQPQTIGYEKKLKINIIKNLLVVILILIVFNLSVTVNNYKSEFDISTLDSISYIGTAFSPDLSSETGMALPFDTYIAFYNGKSGDEISENTQVGNIDSDVLNVDGVTVLTYIDKNNVIKSDGKYKTGDSILTISIDNKIDINAISSYVQNVFIMNESTAVISENLIKIQQSKVKIISNVVVLMSLLIAYIVISMFIEKRSINSRIQSICYLQKSVKSKMYKNAFNLLVIISLLCFMRYSFIFGAICYLLIMVIKKIDLYFESRLNDTVSNW